MKLLDIISENKILISRRTSEEREKNHIRIINKQIQEYIKNGSNGILDLTYTPIKKLPDNLKKVNGGLNLYNSKIESLPEGLVINGFLNLGLTSIKTLPGGLHVTNDLFIDYTPIETLPPDLYVGGELFLFDTPLSKKYNEEEIRNMVKYVDYDKITF